MVPAVDVPELVDRHDGRAHDRRLRRAPLHRARSSGSIRRPSRERARSSSMSASRTPTARCAAACSRRAAIALAASAPVADAAGDGDPHRSRAVLRLDDRERQARQAHRDHRPRATTLPGAIEIEDRAAGGRCRSSGASFDNLKDGAPAIVKAPSGGAGDSPASTRRRRASTQVAGKLPAATRSDMPCGSRASRSATRSSPRW